MPIWVFGKTLASVLEDAAFNSVVCAGEDCEISREGEEKLRDLVIRRLESEGQRHEEKAC